MALLKPKEFIDVFFVQQLNEIVERFPYHAFIIMSTGIEFLGRCLKGNYDWETERVSRELFEHAITKLDSLKKYAPYLKNNGNYDLYVSLRCGLSHSASPKFEITLSSKAEAPHMTMISGRRLNLRCEDFFYDFKTACENIIRMDFDIDDKMNENFLTIPDIGTDDDVTGTTLATPRF